MGGGILCPVNGKMAHILSGLYTDWGRGLHPVQPCGIDYELKAFVADSVEDKIHKRNSVVLAIRKLTYAAEEPAPQPNAETVKEFMMCSGNLRLEVTLDKEVGRLHPLHCFLHSGGRIVPAPSV